MAIEKQIWIDALMEGFMPDTSFLADSVDMSEHVEHNKINLAEAGIDPKVLIDNTDYPVATSSREDMPLELPLHTFDTENTIVRNIEQKELAYNKVDSVVRSHRNALLKKEAAFAAHNWCPTKNSEFTPVFATAGAVNKAGYKALSFEDILNIVSRYRMLDVDIATLVSVLSPIHHADLQAEDMKLYKEVLASGNIFGLKLHSFSRTPTFNSATGVRNAFGAAAADTDTVSSLVYCKTEVMRAVGTTDAFVTLADPGARGDILGYQQRFTALPIRGKYIGAIYSGK